MISVPCMKIYSDIALLIFFEMTNIKYEKKNHDYFSGKKH